jgi:predicted transcriptional regulator
VGDPIHFGYGAGDANGVSGPGSGYRPTLNSNASVSNTSNNTAAAQNTADNSILTEQLNKLDRIMQATERQAQLAQQMLSYAS